VLRVGTGTKPAGKRLRAETACKGQCPWRSADGELVAAAALSLSEDGTVARCEPVPRKASVKTARGCSFQGDDRSAGSAARTSGCNASESRVPSDRSGALDHGSGRDPRALAPDALVWHTRLHSLGPGQRVHRWHGHALAARSARRPGVHSAWPNPAQRIGLELQCKAGGRMSEPRVVPRPDGSTSPHRAMAQVPQPPTTPRLAWQPNPGPSKPRGV
jgi:hypothetical protein